jgi:hypothetical protein
MQTNRVGYFLLEIVPFCIPMATPAPKFHLKRLVEGICKHTFHGEAIEIVRRNLCWLFFQVPVSQYTWLVFADLKRDLEMLMQIGSVR